MNYGNYNIAPAIGVTLDWVVFTGVINFISLVLGVYILFVLVKVNVKRALQDYHYRLRLFISLFTTAMLTLNSAYHFIIAFEGYTPTAEFLYGIILFLTVTIVLLVFLLTIHLYIRICMVLPDSLTYKVLKALCYCSVPLALLLGVLHLLRNWWYPIRRQQINWWIHITMGEYWPGFFNNLKTVVEITVFAIASLVEYVLTYCMIKYSINTSLNFNDSANGTFNSPINRRQQMLLMEKQKFILWVILWCSIIILVDVFNAGTQLYFSTLWNLTIYRKEQIFIQIQILSLSWISARVFCIFKLLDMFLNKIKHIQQDGKKAKREPTEMTEMTTITSCSLQHMEQCLSDSMNTSADHSKQAQFHDNQGKLYSLDFRESFSN